MNETQLINTTFVLKPPQFHHENSFVSIQDKIQDTICKQRLYTTQDETSSVLSYEKENTQQRHDSVKPPI
jgi:hypothetical protein